MNKRILRKYDGLKYGWLKDAKKFLLLLVLLFVIFQQVIGLSIVEGDSMEPTLHNGELVFYVRLNPKYQKGDVVSVRIPSGEFYVKRIIAVEGDTVDIRDGEVYINDVSLHEPYIQGETFEREGIVHYPLTLQENQVFVMGDNRLSSMDSRSFGVVGKRQIKGKLLFHAGKYYIQKVT